MTGGKVDQMFENAAHGGHTGPCAMLTWMLYSDAMMFAGVTASVQRAHREWQTAKDAAADLCRSFGVDPTAEVNKWIP